MIIRHKKTTFMSCCSRVNISTITCYCNDIISYKIMIYLMFLSYVFILFICEPTNTNTFIE